MCTVHFCVDLSVVHLYISENSVINAFPGYCMVPFPVKNTDSIGFSIAVLAFALQYCFL